jgi:hypothetical protein
LLEDSVHKLLIKVNILQGNIAAGWLKREERVEVQEATVLTLAAFNKSNPRRLELYVESRKI